MTTERLTMDCIYCNADSYLDDGGTWECDFGHRFAAAPERAPAYAGHQAHPCPVCLNVHGGEGLTVEALARVLKAQGFVRGVASRYGNFNDVYWEQSAAAILAALTERSAT